MPNSQAAASISGKVVVTVQSPLSGSNVILGTGLRNGATLAAMQLARPLADLGLALELRTLDDQAQAEVAAANATQVAQDPEVLCVVGHLDADTTLAALPVYAKASLPLVAPASADIELTNGTFTNTLRLIGRDDVQATVGAYFAEQRLSAKRVYIVYEPSPYGEVVAQAFRERARAAGLSVLGFTKLSGEGIIEGLIEEIRPTAPDLIYIAAHYSQAGPFVRQLRASGIEAALLAPDGIDSPEMQRLAGEQIGTLYYTTLAAPVEQMPYATQFAADYQTLYASGAPPYAAHAYDATAICIAAIAQAAEAAGGYPDRRQVLDALLKLKTYEGVVGSYSFTQRGDLEDAPYYVIRAGAASWVANPIIASLTAPPP